MKTVLGLDLGVASIGWALVREAENEHEVSSIVKLGVRVNPLSVDESMDFEKGKKITTNANRTLKRSMRRNLQRYKLRREKLIEILKQYGLIPDETILSEQGNYTTFQTYRFRAKAAVEQIPLQELARVLLMINKKRGYKSSRKVKSKDEGQLIDSMEVAKRLYDENLTPGQLTYALLQEGKKYIPDFYRSDLEAELDKIWNFQKPFYSEVLTDDFRKNIEGKAKLNTSKTFLAVHGIYTAENKEKDKRMQAAKWRVDGLQKQLTIEEVAFVISELNGLINNSSGYLGAISDRSKELYFKKQTIGQYLMEQLDENPHASLKNKVFYRQDYLDEFNRIWEVQASYYTVLTPELKNEIRDVIIFYQRRLKSQKGLIGFCEFESKSIVIVEDGKKKTKINGLRVCPKSSPIFQEFKIWQTLNNIKIGEKGGGIDSRFLYQEEKEILFQELNVGKTLKDTEVLKLLSKNPKDWEINFSTIGGNTTQEKLFAAYEKIIELSGHGKYEFRKMASKDVLEIVRSVFSGLGYNTAILTFDSSLKEESFQQQALYRLWHLLYSFEGDSKSKTGYDSLINKVSELCNLEKEYASILANVAFENEYGNLSTKALRKILPHLKEGYQYSDACEKAGYRHSKNSLTKVEKENKVYKERLDSLSKNSLRNPVVEKILNQMVNVINMIIDTYGKFDEVRIELARELKKNARQREKMTEELNKAALKNQEYKTVLSTQFGLTYISRTDLIRYRLYEELKNNGYRTLYSNTYISPNKLFSKDFDIEHIIPKDRLFDDSFSNKTLELRSVNQTKGNNTAYDYIFTAYGDNGLNEYLQRVEALYKEGTISKAKYANLKRSEGNIPDDFINRDLNDTQYIAKKAKEMLEELVGKVVVTTGSVTDRLREDWQLVNVMKELNWNKYKAIGLTEIRKNRDGEDIGYIKDWTKRNDHRHHAMDALTVAFTKQAYIQYLNTLNAHSGEKPDKFIANINGKSKIVSPMPLDEFRAEAKRQLGNILVSFKSKNKVVTTNINKSKIGNGVLKKKQFTPRGQLHNETIYGSVKRYGIKEEKIGAGFDEIQIENVVNQRYRTVLLARLKAFDGDPKKAFTGKNSLSKNPLYLDDLCIQTVPEKVKIVTVETVYTIRKEVSPDLKLEKVVDVGIRKILQARLDEYNSNAKMAFSNLDENPIWLNKEKGIAIKRVKITGISNADALHDKKDKDGRLILNKEGNRIPVDFVNTGNNHHVAIYKDKDGDLQEKVVSFYEATMRANLNLPVVDKLYNQSEGWKFLFTMKQNDYFVFPNPQTGFDPGDIDLKNPDNYVLISPNLFRVQKISTRDYSFRHHLETTVDDHKLLKGVTWLRLGLNGVNNIVKVRVNHIGEIVHIGE